MGHRARKWISFKSYIYDDDDDDGEGDDDDDDDDVNRAPTAFARKIISNQSVSHW